VAGDWQKQSSLSSITAEKWQLPSMPVSPTATLTDLDFTVSAGKVTASNILTGCFASKGTERRLFI